MPKPRPTEVKAIVALLEGEADDVEDLARRVIEKIDEVRADRPGHILVKATNDGHLMMAYGPYNTLKQVETAYSKGRLPVMEGERYGICRLWSEEHAEAALEAADAPRELSKVPHKHPVPYALDDEVSRRRLRRMTDAQKKQAFAERVGI